MSPSITNYVLVGGSGSGKSVVAINLATELAQSGHNPIHFFDLDQTKPLFRSRDMEAILAENGVLLHTDEQFYDAPAISIGVIPFLRSEELTIVDVGGDERGARMLGQFSDALAPENTVCYYVINPYRPWSAEDTAIYETVATVIGASRISHFSFLANPNLGEETTAETVLTGFSRLQDALRGRENIAACCADRRFFNALHGRIPVPLIPLSYYIRMAWD